MTPRQETIHDLRCLINGTKARIHDPATDRRDRDHYRRWVGELTEQLMELERLEAKEPNQ